MIFLELSISDARGKENLQNNFNSKKFYKEYLIKNFKTLRKNHVRSLAGI